MSDSTSSAPSPSKFAKPSYLPLLLAALFMTVGITALVYLGREETRLRGTPIGELDLQPLLFPENAVDPAELRGKVVVLHFWGFWCGPCLMEYPEFAKLQKEYIDSADVEFASIACGDRSPDTKDDLAFYTKKYLDREKIEDMPIYWDPAEFSRQQVSLLFKSGGFSYPTTIVLDKQGKIADIWRGAINGNTLKNSIEAARKQ
ncbi:Thiol-disulfide oxidoreductase ResA [Pirellula sp. SH-Sr6A]|uniref:TlpA family protein disulfide reductase n=1 Tax=Pirellula sp. SH-Sr6A TaxID=1632865 RepID=UPI00078E8002|nr:TlpA family protein disulfide reductase [Pirellula sp. SH-Sr6A]AMV35030.1 Thiol-disulfide oxidoreductase ResA [Pirellula sp. SH-Sr6A]